jgi:hypothetical protein
VEPVLISSFAGKSTPLVSVRCGAIGEIVTNPGSGFEPHWPCGQQNHCDYDQENEQDDQCPNQAPDYAHYHRHNVCHAHALDFVSVECLTSDPADEGATDQHGDRTHNLGPPSISISSGIQTDRKSGKFHCAKRKPAIWTGRKRK